MLSPSAGGPSIRSFIEDFLTKELDDFLHRNSSVADALKKTYFEQSERERKDIKMV
jgi:topoisomerase-4 subunit B